MFKITAFFSVQGRRDRKLRYSFFPASWYNPGFVLLGQYPGWIVWASRGYLIISLEIPTDHTDKTQVGERPRSFRTHAIHITIYLEEFS